MHRQLVYKSRFSKATNTTKYTFDRYIRNNHKDYPKEMVSKKLKREEFIAEESREGITILKWKEKRDVLLSTKHPTEMEIVKTKTQFISKPKIIVDYNTGKSIDLSDQMTAYNNPLRKSMKWYRKLGFELLPNISVANAFLYIKR